MKTFKWLRSFDESDVLGIALVVSIVAAFGALALDLKKQEGGSDVDVEFGAPVRVVGAADRAVEEAHECVSTRGGLVLCVLDDDSGARVVRVLGMERGI